MMGPLRGEPRWLARQQLVELGLQTIQVVNDLEVDRTDHAVVPAPEQHVGRADVLGEHVQLSRVDHDDVHGVADRDDSQRQVDEHDIDLKSGIDMLIAAPVGSVWKAADRACDAGEPPASTTWRGDNLRRSNPGLLFMFLPPDLSLSPRLHLRRPQNSPC
jgi:hypothetical protein